MDYLAREDAPFSQELWNKIDKTVVEQAKQHLVCRRFLNIYGPLGMGASIVNVDGEGKANEVLDGGFERMVGRKMVELPQLFEDFAIYWRDMAESEAQNVEVDLSAAAAAAQKSAKREDKLILFGNKELGAEGLFNAKGTHVIKRKDWSVGEEAYQNVAEAVAYLSSNGYLGSYALLLSPEVYLELQRLQPSVGLLEIDRISKLVGGRVYAAGQYGAGKAALVCAEPQYMDLAIGADLSVGYVEKKDFNHYLRIMETAALRIKDPKAIVSFEASK